MARDILNRVNRLEVAIAVPVRNEAEHLPRLLDALARQIEAPACTLVLFFDNCSDDSQGLVAALAPTLPFPVVTDYCHAGGPPSAGSARRQAMSIGAALLPDGVLMTTDADSRPAPDWIAANLAGLAQADMVAGRIVCEAGHGAPGQARLAAYYDRLHALRRRLDPVEWEAADTHHWTSGASLAMRTAVYQAVSGFPPVASGEDAALADAAARLGFTLRRDARARVLTSARRLGRTANGFAALLAALDETCSSPTVAHPADEAWRYMMQAKARRTHDEADYHQVAEDLGLAVEEVVTVAAECVNGEAFAARIVAGPPGGMRDVTLAHAELLLAGLEQDELEGVA